MAEAELIAGHLGRAIDDVALIVFLPIEGNDTVRLSHSYQINMPG
jgi:hypothetical protein